MAIGATAAHAAADSGTSRDQAIQQLEVTRQSIDRTLELVKAGAAERAFAEAKDGYLSHFELVEVPLRVADASLTSDAETMFAEIRGLISAHAPTSDIVAKIVELRRLMDDAERTLTDQGLTAPAVVAGESFIIIFREGLEAVLLITVLLGYLDSAKATDLRRPIFAGMAAAVVACVGTFFLLRGLLAVVPFGREMLEAATGLFAVGVLICVAFWLSARLDERRRLEFLKARVWNAVTVGSASALVLIGFTAIYREGFETALFYQALLSFGPGLGRWVLVGLGLGLLALVVVAWAVFKLGRRLPVKQFLIAAVVVLMATSVAFLGNAVRSLQEADKVALHRYENWPQLPIFVRQSIGYWPSRETFVAQAVLLSIYLVGIAYLLLVRPLLDRRTPVDARGVPAAVSS